MSTPAPDNPKQGLSWRTKLALGCVLSPLVILIIGGIIVAVAYAEFLRRGNNDLQREVAAVRKSEAPLNSLELNDSYAPMADGTDAAQEIINNLASAADAEFRQASKEFPILGNRPHWDLPPPGTDWPQRTEIEEFLGQHRALLDYCSTLPGRNITARYPADVRFGMATQLSHCTVLRRMHGLLTLQIYVGLHAGEPAAAAQSIRQQLALARTLEREPAIISQLSRLASVGNALNNLELLLQHFELSDEDLQTLQAEIRQVDARATLQTALIGERAMYFTEMSLPLDQFCNKNGAPLEIIEASADEMPARTADAALMLANFRRLIAANDESLHRVWRESQQLNVEWQKMSKSPQRLLYTQTLLLFPAIPSGGVAGILRCDARCKSMDLLLAAMRYRKLHQSWPMSAAQLVPKFVPEVPLDPFSNQPLRWKLQNNELKIYSVCENEVDDGGKWSDREWSDLGFSIPAPP